MHLNTVTSVSGFRYMSKDLITGLGGTTNSDRNDSNSNSEPSKENRATSMVAIKKYNMLMFASILLLRDPNYFPDLDTFKPSGGERLFKRNHGSILSLLELGKTLENAELKTVLLMLCARYEFTVDEEGTNTFSLAYTCWMSVVSKQAGGNCWVMSGGYVS